MSEARLFPSQTTCETTLLVGGMDCGSCVAHVSKAASSLAGVISCDVNLAGGSARVRFDASRTSPLLIASAITDAGYPAEVRDVLQDDRTVEQRKHEKHAANARAWFRRAMVGIALWAPLETTHWIVRWLGQSHDGHLDPMTWLSLVVGTVSIVYLGSGFYAGAWRALRRRTTDMDVLIAMGSSVAYVYSLVALLGHVFGLWTTLPHLYFMEAAGLLALISLGHWLEARARDRAGSAIRELLELAPATAVRLNRDKRSLSVAGQNEPPESEVVPVSELKIGQRVLVRPGDRVPIDGVVVEGRSGVDESMISGESLPVTRSVGDSVIGGSLNHDGALVVRVTRVGRETALAQVVRLVERAQESKPPIQRLADRVSAVFVPTVLCIALLTGVGWYVYGTLSGWPPAQTWAMLAKSVCSVLIIACPCALGLAVPAALMVGTGVGARRGILIRDIDALQRAERVRVIVLDKTGTITSGHPAVAEVRPVDGIDESELLRLAASAEQFSPHPLAQAIVRHVRERGIPLVEPTSFRNVPGLGVRATIDGVEWLVGGEQLTGMTHDADDGASTVHVARARADDAPEPLGSLLLRDTLKPDSHAAIAALHRLKLRSILLTGDRESVARRIAAEVGIDDVRAEVRPDGKASVIENLQREGLVVAMVGDGINDAPALARADLGIAVGSGSDIAKESGGIVLVGGSLAGVAQAIRLSHATMTKIRQNLFFAFFYNVLAIPLAALGLLNPLIAAAAMALSDVTVIGNALLLRRIRMDE